MPSARKKCICQLCTCGRHMCPHRVDTSHLVLGEEESIKSADLTAGGEINKKERKKWDRSNVKSKDIAPATDQNTEQVITDSSNIATAVTVRDKGNSRLSGSVSDGKTWSSKQIPKTLPIKRPDNLKLDGGADFTTIHKQDFVQKSSELRSMESGHVDTALETQEKSWNKKQIPKTQMIRKPDTLTFSETSQVESNETKAQSKEANEITQGITPHTKFQRPRTSLKLSGPFEADSSYHTAFTPKRVENEIKIKKGTSVSHLKPEGEINFETTSSDYNAALIANRASVNKESGNDFSALRPKIGRPASHLKPEGEISFETTSSDYNAALKSNRASENSESGNDFSALRSKIERPLSHLKPEGEISFETTSSDYNAALLSNINSESGKDFSTLRPKVGRPPSEITIPAAPLSDETTAVTDFKRWKVEKPQRYKPVDTLKLGDSSELETNTSDIDRYLSRSDAIKEKAVNGYIVDSLVEKSTYNGKGESTNGLIAARDTDYSSKHRIRNMNSNLETLTEGTEKESFHSGEDQATASVNDITYVKGKPEDATKREDIQTADAARTHKDDNLQTNGREKITSEFIESPVSVAAQQDPSYSDQADARAHDDEQYLTWDQIRPKPIRPQSNLRQEGGMEFNTTNRSEFVEKSMERVKGIRPKTTTKLPEGNFDATTMNQIMFSHDQGERVNPIRPKSNLHVESGQFIDETTTAREFQQWPIKRPSPVVPKPSLTQEGTMDFTTTNHTEFEEKRPDKVYPIRPSTTNRISGDIDLTTTNRVMHSEFPIERVQKIVPQSNLRVSSGEFNSETTNKSQFQEWEIDRPKPVRPVSNLKQEGSMDFTTMNQLQFEEKQAEKVSQFRPRTSSKITGDFDDTTTNQVMYPAQPMQKLQITKPKSNLELRKGKFMADTTNLSEYQQWQLSKPKAIKPKNNLQQEGKIDFTTTNQTQYGAKTTDRVSQIRPKTNPKITGEFDATTTNQVMYQNVPGEKSISTRPQTNIKLDHANFLDETTSKRDFQAWDYSKPSPIRPNNSIQQEGDIDFTTTNSTQFEGKTAERVSQIRPTTTTKLTGDFEGTTTSQAAFQNNNGVEVVRGKRPSTNIHLEKGKFENQTTARREFQQWEIDRPEAIRPSGNLTQEGTMDFTTSNQTQFEEKQITKTEPIRPHTSSPITGDFEGTTTNQMMYQAPPIEKVHDIRPKDNLRVEDGIFHSETTTSKAYGYKMGSKAESIRPKPSLSQEGEFDFTTSNQAQYNEKPINKTTQMRPKTLTKISDDTFQATTTNQDMFQAPPIDVVHEIRPSNNLHVNEGEFQNRTTARDEYRQWQVEKPKAYQLASSLKQEGDMNFETTNHSEFKERNFDKIQQIRPKTTTKLEGEFDATTTNQIAFQTHGKPQRVKPIRHENNLHLEPGKFYGETTNSKEFRQWVKMENQSKDMKAKQIPAAGIRSDNKRISRKQGVQDKIQSKGNKSNEELYEPWKLSRDKEIINDTNGTNDLSTTVSTGKVIKDDAVGNEVKTQDTIIQKEDTDVKERERYVNNHVPAESMYRALTNSGNSENYSHDISVSMADYGPIEAPKSKSVVTATKLNQEEKTRNVKSDNNKKTAVPKGQLKPSELENSDLTVAQNSKSQKVQGKEVADSGISRQREATNIIQNGIRDSNDIQENKGSTATHQSYQNVPTARPIKRFRPDDNLKLEPVPFDGTSTTRAEYKRWEARRASAKKRSETLKQEGKMEFNRTSEDYSLISEYNRNREATKAQSKAGLKGSLGQTGNMDFSTTSTSSYKGNRAFRAQNLRPRSSLRLGTEGPSEHEPAVSSRSNPESSSRDHNEFTSTSHASYMGRNAGKRMQTYRPSTSQKVGEGAFEGESTTRSTFTMLPRDRIEKPRIYKPENHNILDTGDKFSGDTTYRSSFESAKSLHCPVIDLEAGRSSLALYGEKNGHLFYAPRVQG
ncbi:uncharacterized protein LOC118183952 [Stegodyphus dumicola]|uniref:uncharacterized protein LOC118183952 n=1 Tax=Stegodyphus dumicola TaxID=202533 RepID=UPI0015AECB27|nr:uncharacterized protein LOC118183952 [Stegodyphus dumicola]